LGRLYDFDSLVDNLMQSLDAAIAIIATTAISKELEKLDVGEGWWFSNNVIVRVDPKLDK